MITVLQVGYDKLLLQSRALLLGQRGFRVISALGNGTGFTVATTEKIDLILIGHSAPTGIRENAANHFKDHFPAIPVIALRSNALQEGLLNADYNSTAEDPEEWLNVVAKAALQPVHP